MLRFITLSTLVCFTFAAPRLTTPRLDGRIVGGSNANIEDYPYQVSLLILGSHICGGSIISNTWIVTAAHCTELYPSTWMSIRAGSSIRNSGGTVISVTQKYEHPNYDTDSLNNDIAILQLSSGLVYSDSIQPIALPTQNQNVAAGTNSVVSGWGVTAENGQAPLQLQVVEVPIISLADCRLAYSTSAVTDNMICAGFLGVGGADACQGDSGGPLVADGVLAGVVSWGYGCARPFFPGVYASVPALRSYISQITGV